MITLHTRVLPAIFSFFSHFYFFAIFYFQQTLQFIHNLNNIKNDLIEIEAKFIVFLLFIIPMIYYKTPNKNHFNSNK